MKVEENRELVNTKAKEGQEVNQNETAVLLNGLTSSSKKKRASIDSNSDTASKESKLNKSQGSESMLSIMSNSMMSLTQLSAKIMGGVDDDVNETTGNLNEEKIESLLLEQHKTITTFELMFVKMKLDNSKYDAEYAIIEELSIGTLINIYCTKGKKFDAVFIKNELTK